MYFPSHTQKKKNQEDPAVIQHRGLPYLKGWTMPKLHDKKAWYIEFYCIDPRNGLMRRKRFYVPAKADLRERYLYASQTINLLTEKLQKGWNPWTYSKNVSTDSPSYGEISGRYSMYVEKMYMSSQIRRWTYLDWVSYHKNFDSWLMLAGNDIETARDINLSVVTSFLDYLLLDRRVSAQTRNNYRAWLYQYCEWLIERGYMEANPVKGTKKLRIAEKQRNAFTAAELLKLKEYLEPRNKHFLLACLMEYYCFVRPIELVQVRLQFFNIRKQQLFIPGTISKNGRDYVVGLNPTVIGLMVELGVFDAPGDWFLFGKDFRPSALKADSRIFRDYFVGVRRALKWPMSKQFYSLKDSGIRDLANAEGIVVARDQARHQDIETTNRYLKADALTAPEATKHFKGGL